MAKTLTGKVALVTGGSRSMGAAIAKRLAAEGTAVALTYSASPDKAEAVVRDIDAAGGKARAIRATESFSFETYNRDQETVCRRSV